tara:strand:+ start:3127 stop:3369 length:243 start_codon:yes stop_codon:yes gene_type:complete
MSDDFDFGFTAVNEDELEVTKEIKVSSEISKQQLDKLYNAIVPLLNNLKANPEKDYILWPDRLAKVEEFETVLQKIYRGG